MNTNMYIFCDFCGKAKSEVLTLIESNSMPGKSPPKICDECIEGAVKLISKVTKISPGTAFYRKLKEKRIKKFPILKGVKI